MPSLLWDPELFRNGDIEVRDDDGALFKNKNKNKNQLASLWVIGVLRHNDI